MKRAFVAVIVACVAAAGGILAQERDSLPYRALAVTEIPIQEREILHYRVYGEGVMTYFINDDTSTCASGVRTTVILHGDQGVVYENGYPTESSIVSIMVSVYDRCADLLLSLVIGTGPAEELHVNPNLKSASLRTSFYATELLHDNPVTVSVDLVWNGAGQPENTSDHDRYNVGDQLYVSNANGTIRDAVAGGSVTVGTVDITPNPSIHGSIEKDSTRTVSFYR